MVIEGELSAKGKDSQTVDYTSIAAGAGGSIKFSAQSITLIGLCPNPDSDLGLDHKIGPSFKYQLDVGGGKPNLKMGGGGGGKIILDCRNSLDDTYCIKTGQFTPTINIRTGDYNIKPIIPKYYISQKMLQKNREFIFNGAVLNTYLCRPGQTGVLCKSCPEGTYKSTMGSDDCIPCPCQSTNTEHGLVSVTQCKCRPEVSNELGILDILKIFLCFCVTMLFTFLIMQRNKKYIDKNYLSELRYKVKDIPDTQGRIFVSGSNTPNQPWKIQRLPSELEGIVNLTNFNKFRRDIEEDVKWSRSSRILLSFTRIFFYSPLYLTLIRLMKISRVNNFTKILAKQDEYQIFKIKRRPNIKGSKKLTEEVEKSSKIREGEGSKKKLFLIKWTSTSDQSTLFLDIVEC